MMIGEKPRVTRLAKRMFAPLFNEKMEPANLDLRGIDRATALRTISRLGDLVRVCDGPDPLTSKWVFTGGAEWHFLPWYKRLFAWLGMAT